MSPILSNLFGGPVSKNRSGGGSVIKSCRKSIQTSHCNLGIKLYSWLQHDSWRNDIPGTVLSFYRTSIAFVGL